MNKPRHNPTGSYCFFLRPQKYNKILNALILTLFFHVKENTFPNSPWGEEGKNYGQINVHLMLYLKTIFKPAYSCDRLSNPALLSQAQPEGWPATRATFHSTGPGTHSLLTAWKSHLSAPFSRKPILWGSNWTPYSWIHAHSHSSSHFLKSKILDFVMEEL